MNVRSVPEAVIGGASAPEELRCEFLVIGSGAGGALSAALLAEAGRDVLIVEEGSWVAQGEVVPFSLDQMDRQYRSGGVTVALGLPSIAYTEGRCAGGGTEVNSGLYRRPPADIIERWRERYRIESFTPEHLERWATTIERDLSVGLLPGPPTPASAALARGAAALGWEHSEIPRWMVYAPDGERRQSMTETYLPRSFAAGARLLTEARVHRLRGTADRAHSAEVHLPGGRRCRVQFDQVLVCAGAIQTPALLQRSGHRGRVGMSLAVHPTVKLTARFDDVVNIPDEVPVHQVKEFAPELSFGGSASHPGLVALALSDSWSDFGPLVTDWQRMSVYYAAITSQGRGRVVAVPGMRDPVVTYHLTGRDRQLLRSGLGRLTLLMLEAGAVEVLPAFRGAPRVTDRRSLAQMQAGFAATKASVMTVHLCSTVPMGEDRSRCAADSFGRLHGTSNVIVNDASLLPDAPGVNPQGSVMAIAARNVEHLLGGVLGRGGSSGA